jgi:hypothetical protein
VLRCAAWLIGLLCLMQTAAAQVESSPSSAAGASADGLKLALFPAHTSGVDPAVAGFVDRALRAAAEALGHDVLDGALEPAGDEAPVHAGPPGAHALSQAIAALDADCGVLAVVWASRGRYAVQLRALLRDAPAPAVAQAEVSPRELERVTARLLAQVLPSPATAAESTAPERSAAQPAAEPEPEPAPPPLAPPQRPRFRLALHNDLAFGVASDPFLNEVLGARADVRAGDALWLGAHCGYANLPGRGGRVDSVLCYGQAEQRIAFGSGRAGVPLRLAAGYLAGNGGFLRVSSGLAFPLGERSELVLDLVAPSFWATPDKTLFALALGAELAIEL